MIIGVIRVHPDALADAADAAEHSADRLGELLTAVDHVVHNLAAEWSGAASDGFQQTATRWQSASVDLHASLRELRELLAAAYGNYTGCEAANLRMWGTH